MYTKKIYIFSLQIILSIFFFISSIINVAHAAPLFISGQTLDPNCAPTNPDCTIIPPAAAGVNSDITALSSLTAGTSTNFVVNNLFTALSGYILNLRIGSLDGLLVGTNGNVSSIATSTLLAGYIKNLSSFTTDSLTEGSINQYFNTARARNSLSSISPIVYSTTTGQISLAQASSTVNGYLSSTDWNTFNNKISSQWTASSSNIYYTLGNIGIGTTTPLAKLSVIGDGFFAGNLTATGTIQSSNLAGINTGDENSYNIEPNLISTSTVFTTGKYASWTDGTLGLNASYQATDYIPVAPNVKYIYRETVGDNTCYGAYYDSAKVFISGIGGVGTFGPCLTTAPANAAYVRLTYQNVPYSNNYFYFNRVYKFGSFGDSITTADNWQPQISTQLSFIRFNYGISATKVSGTDPNSMNNDNRINAIATDTDILVFLGGTNDWLNNIPLGSQTSTSTSDFYGGLNITLEKLKARLPNTVIVALTTPYGESPYNVTTNSLGLASKDYADAVYNAAINNNVRVIRIDDLWNHDNASQYILPQGAWIHPNTAGGLLMARRISNGLWQEIAKIKSKEATVNNANMGTQYQTAYYASNGSTVSGTSTITIKNEMVGIGVAPLNKLQVDGDIAALAATNSTNRYLKFQRQGDAYTGAAIGSIYESGYRGSLGFFTNNGTSASSTVEAMRINSYGNVGIGDTTPSARLEIDQISTDTTTPFLRVKRTNEATPQATNAFEYVNNSDTMQWKVDSYGRSWTPVGYFGSLNPSDYNNATNPLNVVNQTSDTIAEFDSGAAVGRAMLRFKTASSTGYMYQGIYSNPLVGINNTANTQYIYYGSNLTPIMVMNNPDGGGNGNVGIGTTSPYKTLSVAGDIGFTGGLYRNGDLLSLTARKTPLTNWFNGGISGKKIIIAGDSTSDGSVSAAPLYSRLITYQAPGRALASTTILDFGSNGLTADGFITGIGPKGLASAAAAKADLYVISFGINDVRQGASTQQQIQDRLSTIVDTIRAQAPDADIVLRMPNSFLSTDTGPGYVVPNSSAQAYTDILRNAYLALANKWPNVTLFATQPSIFPTTIVASSPIMADQLHPTPSGYNLIADALVAIIGSTNTGSQWISNVAGNNTDIYFTSGNVSIGTSTATSTLTLSGKTQNGGFLNPLNILAINPTFGGYPGAGVVNKLIDVSPTFVPGWVLSQAGSGLIGLNVDITGSAGGYAALFKGGNVGVGTSTPQTLLTVAGKAAFTGDFSTGNGFTTPFKYVDVNPQLNGFPGSAITNTLLSVKPIYSSGWNNTNNATLLGLNVDVTGAGGNTQSAIFQGGNVGIGTSTPQTLLTVAGKAAFTGDFPLGNGFTTPFKYIDVNPQLNGFPGSAITNTLLNVKPAYASGWNNTNSATLLGLNVDVTGAGGNTLAAIFQGGNVGVGTSTPTSKLTVIGSTYLNGDATTTGSLFLTGLPLLTTGNYLCIDTVTKQITSGTTCTLSSGRFKDNIAPIDMGLSTVLALNPVTFKFKNGYGDNGNTTQMGFIAEQANSIDPRLVPHDENGLPSGFNYANFTAVLTKAIQEQQVQINALKNVTTTTTVITQDSYTVSSSTIANILDSINEISEKIKNIVADSITAVVATFTNLTTSHLTVGSENVSSGITIYDKVTHQPFCIQVVNGQMQNVAGTCDPQQSQNSTSVTASTTNNNTNTVINSTNITELATSTTQVLASSTPSTTTPVIIPNEVSSSTPVATTPALKTDVATTTASAIPIEKVTTPTPEPVVVPEVTTPTPEPVTTPVTESVTPTPATTTP